MYRYLIFYYNQELQNSEVFYDNYFDPKNNFAVDGQMTVCDLHKNLLTTDGETWNPIEENHL